MEQFEEKKFYFIKDGFFEKFKNYELMQNKEDGNKRPCFFCFRDKKYKDIIWFVPISSKVGKYKAIYEKKKQKQSKVYNFVFGKLLGQDKVFLIQNMFPTTEEYIDSKYQTREKDVEITKILQDEIIIMANNVINLAEKGINIPFYSIIEMRNILIKK